MQQRWPALSSWRGHKFDINLNGKNMNWCLCYYLWWGGTQREEYTLSNHSYVKILDSFTVAYQQLLGHNSKMSLGLCHRIITQVSVEVRQPSYITPQLLRGVGDFYYPARSLGRTGRRQGRSRSGLSLIRLYGGYRSHTTGKGMRPPSPQQRCSNPNTCVGFRIGKPACINTQMDKMFCTP